MSEHNTFLRESKLAFVGIAQVNQAPHGWITMPVFKSSAGFVTLLWNGKAYELEPVIKMKRLREPNWRAYDGSTCEREIFDPQYIGKF